jgi:hypothetical protein
MHRKTTLTLLAALSLGLMAYAAEEQTAQPKEQTHCPVMERYPVDKTLHIDVKGKRIYVCCKGCTNQIKANPDKYIKRLEDKGIVIDKTPKKHDHSGHTHGHDHSGHKH